MTEIILLGVMVVLGIWSWRVESALREHEDRLSRLERKTIWK